jgi:hypothetical protein
LHSVHSKLGSLVCFAVTCSINRISSAYPNSQYGQTKLFKPSCISKWFLYQGWLLKTLGQFGTGQLYSFLTFLLVLQFDTESVASDFELVLASVFPCWGLVFSAFDPSSRSSKVPGMSFSIMSRIRLLARLISLDVRFRDVNGFLFYIQIMLYD